MSDKYLKIIGGLNINSTTDNKTIKAYSKNGETKYVVGGKAAFKAKSNIIDWEIYKDLGQKDKIVYVINDILNIPYKIDDPKKLTLLLNEINNLPKKDLIKVLTDSMELNEALVVALRRLYYVWADVIELLMDKSNIKDPDLSNYIHKGFCPYEPKERVLNILEYPIEQFLDKIDLEKVNFNEIYEKIKEIEKEIDLLLDKSIDLKVLEKSKENTINKDLEKNMDIFVENYKELFEDLQKQEEIYIALAEHIEKITDSIELIFE